MKGKQMTSATEDMFLQMAKCLALAFLKSFTTSYLAFGSVL